MTTIKKSSNKKNGTMLFLATGIAFLFSFAIISFHANNYGVGTERAKAHEAIATGAVFSVNNTIHSEDIIISENGVQTAEKNRNNAQRISVTYASYENAAMNSESETEGVTQNANVAGEVIVLHENTAAESGTISKTQTPILKTQEIKEQTAPENPEAVLSEGEIVRSETGTAFSEREIVRSEAETAISGAETARSEAGTAFSGAETALSKGKTAISGAETAHSEAETAFSERERARSEVETAISGAETAHSEGRVSLSGAETEISDAETGISEAETAFSGAGTALSKGKTAISGAEIAHAEVETAISGAETEISGAGTAHSEAETGISGAEFETVANSEVIHSDMSKTILNAEFAQRASGTVSADTEKITHTETIIVTEPENNLIFKDSYLDLDAVSAVTTEHISFPDIDLRKIRRKIIYPVSMKKQNIEACFNAQIFISEAGVISVSVPENIPTPFVNAIASAFKIDPVKPAILNGTPVKSTFSIPVQFILQ